MVPGNFQELRVKGVDVSADYRLPVRDWLDDMNWLPGADVGSFKAVLQGAYVGERSTTTPGALGSTKQDLVGVGTGLGAIPHWKAQSQLIWNKGPVELSWDLRYIHHTDAICDDGLQALTGIFAPRTDPVRSLEQLGLCDGRKTVAGIPNVPFQKVGSVTYHDVQMVYTLPGEAGRIIVGANNVFGKKTPVTLSAPSGVNFDPTLHELEDIAAYIRYTTRFE